MRVLGLALLVLASLGCVTQAAQQQQVALREGVVLVMQTKAFVEANHEVDRCGESVCLIDGAPVYGAYDSLPTLEIESLFLRVGEQEIALDHSGMYNPWSPREDREIDAWLVEEPGERLVIRGMFSDGAATYVAEWVVIRDASMRTILTCLECLGVSCGSFASGG